jgi:hypothetical protein
MAVCLSICLPVCLAVLTPVLLPVLTPIRRGIAAAALRERQLAERSNHERGKDIGKNFAHRTSPFVIP